MEKKKNFVKFRTELHRTWASLAAQWTYELFRQKIIFFKNEVFFSRI